MESVGPEIRVVNTLKFAPFTGKKSIELEKKRSIQPKVKAKKKKKPVGKSPGKQDANGAVNGDDSMKEMLLEENGVSDHEGEKEAQEAELADKVPVTGNNQIILVQCFPDCSALRASSSLIFMQIFLLYGFIEIVLLKAKGSGMSFIIF